MCKQLVSHEDCRIPEIETTPIKLNAVESYLATELSCHTCDF